jgi:hypothetical protein
MKLTDLFSFGRDYLFQQFFFIEQICIYKKLLKKSMFKFLHQNVVNGVLNQYLQSVSKNAFISIMPYAKKKDNKAPSHLAAQTQLKLQEMDLCRQQ